MEDISNQLAPAIDAFRRRRNALKLSAAELSTLAGYGPTWVTDLEAGRGRANPTISRYIRWATALDAQEFGIYVVFDGHHVAIPLFETDDKDEPVTEYDDEDPDVDLA